MKDYIKNIIEESLNDEADVEKEWKRLSASLSSSKSMHSSVGKGRKVLRQLFCYAAAVFTGFGFALTALHFFERENPVETGMYKLVTLKGEKSHLQLPDGTKVWLNSCTTLEYAENYGQIDRNIHLSGEAYFEVAKDEGKPFVVRTNGVDVKALGTAFNISAYPEDAQLATTLFRGEVAVQPTLNRQQIMLSPNQVAVYYKSGNKIEVKPYDKTLFAQWRGGYLLFEMMHLQDITKLLERNYNVVFRYENQKIKNFKFSGSFRNGEDLTDILNVIRKNTGIRYQERQDTIIIK
ncbi:MAG: DUF4974 domain-containing protein [Tannerellaceae bacterium]|jgi:ferric-dicitrate binding protein FerR (iron transport regulator)|nr:DUF4974 domain-containing protein [Tannerellaceae bacterium]